MCRQSAMGCPASPVLFGHGAAHGLTDRLGLLADPRGRRGRRHSLWSVLVIAVSAVVAGARSYAAIGQWAASAPQTTLTRANARVLPVVGVRVPPSGATIRRVISLVCPGGLAELTGADPGSAESIAVDGKTARGSRHGDTPAAHLLAAMTNSGQVIGQMRVPGKTNEVRREVPCRISHSVRRNSEKGSWIRRLTRISKGDGDQSMPVQTWWSCPRVGTARQGGPRDMANA